MNGLVCLDAIMPNVLRRLDLMLQESISHMEMAQGDTLFLPEQHANCTPA